MGAKKTFIFWLCLLVCDSFQSCYTLCRGFCSWNYTEESNSTWIRFALLNRFAWQIDSKRLFPALADNETVAWLTSCGSWHICKKKLIMKYTYQMRDKKRSLTHLVSWLRTVDYVCTFDDLSFNHHTGVRNVQCRTAFFKHFTYIFIFKIFTNKKWNKIGKSPDDVTLNSANCALLNKSQQKFDKTRDVKWTSNIWCSKL